MSYDGAHVQEVLVLLSTGTAAVELTVVVRSHPETHVSHVLSREEGTWLTMDDPKPARP